MLVVGNCDVDVIRVHAKISETALSRAEDKEREDRGRWGLALVVRCHARNLINRQSFPVLSAYTNEFAPQLLCNAEQQYPCQY
jgi:hypothetical protein